MTDTLPEGRIESHAVIGKEPCTGCGDPAQDHVLMYDRASRKHMLFCWHKKGWNGSILCYHRSITTNGGDRAASACDHMRAVWKV